MHRLEGINTLKIQQIIRDAEIQSVSTTLGKCRDEVAQNQTHITATETKIEDPVFGAASLSKPVFTYLVLKLIEKEDFNLDTRLEEILPFREFCDQYNKKAKEVVFAWNSFEENEERAATFTPAMILSHQTGLPIGPPSAGFLRFDFEPNNGFGYSGINLMYLQACIEKKFGPLEELAKKYVFTPAGMNKSSFTTPDANAANSLYTTAEDYARFCIYWMQDQDPLIQQAFTEKVSLFSDQWAKREHISDQVLNHLAWGYGWGLEKDDAGKIIKAFHTGDMNEWRAGVELDLVAKSVKIFLSKSTYQNGHILQEEIFGKSYSLDYFFDKFKFARTVEELKDDWREIKSYGLRKDSVVNSEHKQSESTPASDVDKIGFKKRF